MTENVIDDNNLSSNSEWSTDTNFLVIVNYFDDDISWKNKLTFPHVVFTKNMPQREPYNAHNCAKSETNLLKFICDFYDQLPRNIINVHQYEHKPYSHDGSLLDILNDIQFEEKYLNSNTVGYWNFCSYIMGHTDSQIKRMLECGWWQECMQPWFGSIFDYHDFIFLKKGCAQFVVSKARILSLPREFYQKLYIWLTTKSIGTGRGHPNDTSFSNFYTSRYMEWTWELIFAVHKPTENVFVCLSSKTKFRALYGADSYKIDVTQRALKCFLKNENMLIVDQNNVFNEIFGDPICNSAKELVITLLDNDGEHKNWIISEIHGTIKIKLF